MSSRKRQSVTQETHSARNAPKNIVVFGESGAGKSSLVNLVVGRSVARTSNSAVGCTIQYHKYEFQADDGTPYAIWDTSGLNEGTYGTVPAKTAVEKIKHLLRDLFRANGIHLLVYCVPGNRLRRALLGDYNLIYSTVCRKKVPIMLVVTGLEYYKKDMEDWWTVNQSELMKHKMHFDGHVCVTTLNADEDGSPVLKQRYDASRQAVLDALASTCAPEGWGSDSDGYVSAILADVRAMLRPSRQKGVPLPNPVILLYDHRQSPLASAKDTSSSSSPFQGGYFTNVGESEFLVYRIHNCEKGTNVRMKKRVGRRGADLLIFCTSLHAEDVGEALQRASDFYKVYGGDTRPFLVVVRDALSDDEASQWWYAWPQQPDAGSMHATVHALPPPESANAQEAAAALQHAIQVHALQPLDVAPTGWFGWLTGRRRPRMHPNSATLFEADSLSEACVWRYQDSR